MEKKFYSVTKKDLFDLFSRLSATYRVIVPYVKNERLYFDDFDQSKEDRIELGGIRQSQPVKSFISHSRETVFSASERENNPKPFIIAGVKGCDLKSFALQDFVFAQGDTEDPSYVKNRDNALIIGNDCTYARQTCFCLAMDAAPYPEKDFDLSLSPVEDRFVVEVGTEKGAALAEKYRMFFKPPNDADIETRAKNREKVSEEVRRYVDARGTPDTKTVKGAVKRNYSNIPLWQDFASTCVECGACNLVCPTCHCFLLFDEKDQGNARRVRIWDSCLYKTFARVAGGANPRRHLYERLRNRFDKKFEFFPEVMNGYFACTGCGRCIEACPGDIDIREVLKGVANGTKWNKPPHE